MPIEMISESLGHTSIKTTEIYLDSFENDRRADISKLLLPERLAVSKSHNDQEEVMAVRS